MKISNEELQKRIERYGDKSNCLPDREFFIDALIELQQLREERRWRKIETLKLYPPLKYFQLATKDEVNPMTFWLDGGLLMTFAEDVDCAGDLTIDEAAETYSFFRPLLMDLPEGEKL